MQDNIPQIRGPGSVHASTAIAMAIIAVAVCLSATPSFCYAIVSVCTPTLMIVFVEMFYRVCLLWEEHRHVKSRYEGNYGNVFINAFTTNWKSGAVVVGCFFLVATIGTNSDKNVFRLWYDGGIVAVTFSFVGVSLLLKNIKPSESPLQTSLLIRDMGGLDYGAGMAYSYFYGYFKLILPVSGTEVKNVRENMSIYEDRHGITFATYKLLILVPLSLYCPVSLENENNPEIEAAETLDEIIITVAGVRNRVYRNSVYKIRTDDGIKYVCAEYATPLKTFRDVLLHNTEHANYYKKHQKELVLQFYLTLRQILQENIDCTDYCELIFFDDMDEDRRTYKNIAPIILERIEEINRR